MKSYSFIAYGHPNILATHKTTLEITKEKFLTKKGNCIIGVNANFELMKLKEFIKNCNGELVEIELRTNGLTESIRGKLNRDFNDENSIVIRKSDFISKRTLVFEADKASCDLERGFVNRLLNSVARISVEVGKSPNSSNIFK